VCRPCTERSLTGHDPRDREPAALNCRTAGHGGISRRKEDQEEEKFGRSSEHYGLLFSDFRPAGAAAHKQRLTAQPQEMFGATRLSLCRRRRNP
jgi:hypothetical protein